MNEPNLSKTLTQDEVSEPAIIKKKMSYSKLTFACMFFLSFWGGAVQAGVLQQTIGAQKSVLLTPFFSILKDQSGSLSPELANVAQFSPLNIPKDSETYALGFMPGALWLKLYFKTGPEAGPMILSQGLWYIHKLNVWLYREGMQQSYMTGSTVPRSQRPIQGHQLAVPLNLEPNTEYELLIRLESEQLMEFNLTLWQPTAFGEEDDIQVMFSTLYIGGLVMLILYNTILAIGMRQRAFFWYGAFLLALLVNMGIMSGDWYHILFKENPQQVHWALPMNRLLMLVLATRFIQEFSLSKVRSPWWHTTLNYTQGIAPILGICTLFLSYGQAQVLVSFFSLVLHGLTLFTVIVVFLQGHREAKFAMLGMALFSLMNALILPRLFGFIPTPFFGFGVGKMIMLVAIGLFGIAMADKLRLLRSERKEARETLLAQAEEHAKTLEITVELRTKELQDSQRELQVANQAKDRFFSILAHDLRGSTGSMNVLFNELIHSKEDLTDEILSLVKKTTRQTYGLLEDLLTWSRSQKGDITFEPMNLNIFPLVDEVFDLLGSEAQQKQIRLVKGALAEFPVFADKTMVSTVIRNLVHNAIKFTGDQGRIEVFSQKQDDMLAVTVQDNGVGIDEKNLANLFKLDERVESTLGTHSEVGTGLGLVLCVEFIQKNGGTITVNSKVGEGSSFTLTLPIGSIETLELEENEQWLTGHLSQLNALIVEDNPLHQRTTSLVFDELGLQYTMVKNGIEAVELASGQFFELVLMDIDIPGMNGIETSQRIREGYVQSPWIIALSSYSKREIEQMSIQPCFDQYIFKPLSRGDLLAHLRPLVEAAISK